MKLRTILTFSSVAALCFTACSQKLQDNPLSAKRVIVIGIDGMSPDGIKNSPTPIMDSIMKSGAYTLTARGVLPTSSSPNWKSMISGSDTEHHGVTSNKWQKDKFILPAAIKGLEDIYPTIFAENANQSLIF